MEKAGGRPRDDVWKRVTLLEGGRRVRCNDCGWEFAASANRIKAHINKVEGKGIRVCPGNANSNIDIEDILLQSKRQIRADEAVDQEGIQVGSSFVSNEKNEDSQMMKRYVFECLRPEDKVFRSPLSYLTQQDFITLKPEAHLDSLVIDIFVEMLTDIERKKKTMASNWYLPITFSDKALEGHLGRFLHYVHAQKLRENYMSDLESCEKIFIPVHVGPRPYGEHFYLYIVHVKNKEIEIWDSLPNTSVAEIRRDETTKKLLLALEKLFEEAVLFTEFHLKMANDILLQPNGFDCGIFVINYMEQSDNYVKRNPLFQFNSQKERDDLVLKLLDNDLNQEKQNLYAKAREHYAQIEKQCGNKRLRVDVGSELEAEYDVSEEKDDSLENGREGEVGGMMNTCAAFSFLGQDISLQIHQQQLDINRLIAHHLQMEKLRVDLEEKRKRQARRILKAIEVGMTKTLRAKEEEMAKIGKLNWALEERMKSLCVENQIWRDLAQTNEATANALRTNLEQVLAQVIDERRFDDDEGATVVPAGAYLMDDALFCCRSTGGVDVDDLRDDGGNEGKEMEARWRRLGWGAKDEEEEEGGGKTRRKGGMKSSMCRKCGREESGMLMLPCRHLCLLCTVCGSSLHTCPVCKSFKTGSVHVNMS